MSEEEELPTTVEALLERMEVGRAAFYASLEGLSAEQLAAPITERDWSVADHMGHIATWMEGISAALEGKNRWVAMGADGPPGDDGFDGLNERLRAPHAHRSPADARAWLDAAHGRLAAQLGALSIDALNRPYRHYQPDDARDNSGEPFLNWVVGDSYSHYDEHRGWIEAALREKGWR